MTDENILKFPTTEEGADAEGQYLIVKAEAERLANQSEAERAFFLPKRAEAIGVPEKMLKAAVTAVLRERAMKTAAEQVADDRERQRQEKERAAEERRARAAAKEEESERQRARKAEELEQQREEKRAAEQKEAEKRQAEKEAERKSKEKSKGFVTLSRLPVARHEAELEKLAKRLGEDPAELRKEFEEFLGVEIGATTPKEATEPWPEAVNAAAVLSELGVKIGKYVVMQPHQLTAAVLWTVHTWLYDHDIVTHSPILAVTSAEADSGKSTLVAVVGRAAPRYSLNIEMTRPSLYRFVDAVKPMLVIDEADDLFVRKSDLRHVINAGWTRGAKIARQVNIGGVSVTVHFDPFTPKAIALLGRNLPQTVRTRSIELRMVPKRPDEQVEEFGHLDDAEFAVLRRKLARWAADNAAALRDARPQMLPGLNNRAAANWKMLLAIAELAGGLWPERAREAAERLARSGRRPSHGVQLLVALKTMFAETGKSAITSEAIVTELRKDPTAVWVDYNRGGPITQRQVACLLDPFDVRPGPLHPTGREDFARRGYKLAQFADAFARYTPSDPIIRSSGAARKPSKRR